MRLPFPERVSIPLTVAAATVVVCLQQLQGTSSTFSVYSFLYIILAAVAFNVAGGFTSTTGAYVFFNSVLGVIIGLVYKAYLGEPADSNLRAPELTIKVFTGAMFSMLIAVIISRKLVRTKPLLGTILKEKDMRSAAIGCFVVGFTLIFLSITVPHENGSVLSALAQLNRFLLMSVIVATLYTIRKSGGKTGIGILSTVCLLANFGFGVLIFSKEGMFASLAAWLVAAASVRLNLRAYQIGSILVVTYVAFHYMVPYAQYGRDVIEQDATFAARVETAGALLLDLEGVRSEYLANQAEQPQASAMSYYSNSQGFFDRLNMLGPDDALIEYTSHGNYSGLSVIPIAIANWVPHFLWPNKPQFLSGNVIAQKIGGIVGEDDNTTGISFSPSGQSYYMAGWMGVFVVAPITWIVLFTLFDSLCGDTRKAPWGLLVISLYSHIAPEGSIDSLIYFMWFGSVGILFVALLTSYVMPLVGTLVAGPGQVEIDRRPTRIMLGRKLGPSDSTT